MRGCCCTGLHPEFLCALYAGVLLVQYLSPFVTFSNERAGGVPYCGPAESIAKGPVSPTALQILWPDHWRGLNNPRPSDREAGMRPTCGTGTLYVEVRCSLATLTTQTWLLGTCWAHLCSQVAGSIPWAALNSGKVTV